MINQLSQGTGLEQQHIALKRAEVDAFADIKGGDVSVYMGSICIHIVSID